MNTGGLKLGGGLGGGLNLGGGLGQTAQQPGGLRLGGGLGMGQSNLGMGLKQNNTGMGLGQNTFGLGLGQQAPNLTLGGSLGSGLGGGGGLTSTMNKGLLGGLNLAGMQTLPNSSVGQGLFGQTNTLQLQQQQQQLSLLQDEKLKFQWAIKSPAVFGDEKDQILVKFNMLQACCGTGKGLVNYNGQLHAINFTMDNPLCRFKTICYNRIPTLRNEDGLVSLRFKTKASELLDKQADVCRKLQEIVGNPLVQVMVESVTSLPDDCSEITVFVYDKSSNRRLVANDVFIFLQSKKPQLELLGVAHLGPKEGLSEDSLKSYLQTPPTGINPQQWEQSRRENPDHTKFVPVPVVGSTALHLRMKQQEQESRKHLSRLQTLSDTILQLKTNHSVTIAKIAEHKRKQTILSHRVLKVMVEQEVLRKSGYSVQPEEEHLRSRLEAIQAELAAPLQFKGRLYELMSQLRMQTQVPGVRADLQQRLDPMVMNEIKHHLEQQQGALTQLIKVIREVNEDLHCMEEGFSQT